MKCNPLKKLTSLLICIIVLLLLISCKTVEYAPYYFNLQDTITPVLQTRPSTPEIIDSCSSFADVMNNSLSWQTAYYQMEDYAGALESLINEIVKSVQ